MRRTHSLLIRSKKVIVAAAYDYLDQRLQVLRLDLPFSPQIHSIAPIPPNQFLLGEVLEH